MLELLPGTLFVTVGDHLLIDLIHIWKAVDNKGTHQHCLRHFITLNVDVL